MKKKKAWKKQLVGRMLMTMYYSSQSIRHWIDCGETSHRTCESFSTKEEAGLSFRQLILAFGRKAKLRERVTSKKLSQKTSDVATSDMKRYSLGQM